MYGLLHFRVIRFTAWRLRMHRTTNRVCKCYVSNDEISPFWLLSLTRGTSAAVGVFA